MYLHVVHLLCRFVGILYDEIYIQEDLVYDRLSSRLIGFINLREVDQQISNLEIATSESFPQVSTRILTLMVRGIFFTSRWPTSPWQDSPVSHCMMSCGRLLSIRSGVILLSLSRREMAAASTADTTVYTQKAPFLTKQSMFTVPTRGCCFSISMLHTW